MLTFPPARPTEQMKGLPAVTRATGLISGLIRQMHLDAYRGEQLMPTPRLCDRPDPSKGWGRARFLGVHVEDYLHHGNAISLVTSRDEDGYPASVMWLPAINVSLSDERPWGGPLRYWYLGRALPVDDVIHVARGADPMNPARGVGVIEQHITSWSKLTDQAQFEADAYRQSGVPSVAVTTTNPDLSQDEADAAKAKWMVTFARREPVILPQGTVVTPLAWSPSDSQMVEAHSMGLQDVANAFGMDGAWLGAPTKGMTYKSVGPMFLSLVRDTIEPTADDFEQIWGPEWLPHGEQLRFRKTDILTDDMPTEVSWIVDAIAAGMMTEDEGRARIGYPARGGQAGVVESVDDRELARAAAEVSQKVYLAVANNLDRDEGRELIRRAGADIDKENDHV